MINFFSNIWFFQKSSNFSHMVWVVSGPAWGCCSTSIKVCSSHTNSLRKSKKQLENCCFLAHPTVGGPHKLKTALFELFFPIFLVVIVVRLWNNDLYIIVFEKFTKKSHILMKLSHSIHVLNIQIDTKSLGLFIHQHFNNI